MRTVVISGGAGGIGSEIARQFLELKDHVILLDINKSKLATLKQGNSALDYYICDVTNTASIRSIVKDIEEANGKVDVLINTAGGGPVGDFTDISDEQWITNITLKQLGYVRMCREFLELIKKSEHGKIINVIGTFGKQPSADFIVGSMTNAALLSFTKAIADDLSRIGINVNAINSGAADTELWSKTLNELEKRYPEKSIETIDKEMRALSGFNRITLALDVANAAEFLASEKSNFMSGTSINIDGGIYAGIS
ncbi:SDR family NAD(P)-dependent oxidoreductase [Enterococcus rivorum]|uniref:Short-chain dehydrogenase n=1 Tax=Enterococcus rivorum TaxID=762845 RepID=A0A1E5KTC5_9ENTE|nr:SDR family NAD(P)-dependent oxidoreductase [Enterococcus rivorum]MBP2098063.1 NAD(P)-dependent dehydrogenase (short-subunit alcohol dehydrogenase family) [Enterococcus rivorum]OEH81008.1 hypothetical protein BCR26_05705 [Enterococcus rivorum]